MAEWMDLAGSALGAVGSIGGGLLGRSQSSDGFSKKGAGQKYIFDIGTMPTYGTLQGQYLGNMAKEMKVHPLAVLGQSAGGQPVIEGQPGDNRSIGDGVSRAFEGMGQDIRNARYRNMDALSRALHLDQQAADIEKTRASKELILEEIRRLKNPPAPDATPPGAVKTVDKQVLPVQKNDSSKEAGTEPMYQWRTVDRKGGQRKVLAEGMDEKFDSDHVNSIIYNVENALEYIKNMLHNPGSKGAPPKKRLPKGYDYWKYSPINKTWYPAKGKRLKTNRDIVKHMNKTLDSF